MNPRKPINKFCEIIIAVTFWLTSTSCLQAQQKAVYNPHDIIDAGNGLKLEILNCRGENESSECDAILYTTKRQFGKRRWIKTSLLQQLQSKINLGRSTDIADSIKNSIENLQIAGLQKPVVTGSQKSALTQIIRDPIATKKIDVPSPINKTPHRDTLVSFPKKQPTIIEQQPTAVKVKESQTAKPTLNVANIKPRHQIFTLEDCYRTALNNNLSLKRAENNITNFQIDHKTAQNSLLPSVSYNMGHYFSFGKNIDPVTNTFSFERFSGGYTALGLQVDLFAGFRKLNTIKQSSFLIASSQYDKKREKSCRRCLQDVSK